MGQGVYTMLAFGTTDVPEKPDAIEDDDWYGWQDMLDERRIRSQYEAEPPYLAIPLAVSDGWLCKRWGVPEMIRTVVPVGDIASFVAPALEEARELWRRAQAEVAKHGRTLPDAMLLLISDFD